VSLAVIPLRQAFADPVRTRSAPRFLNMLLTAAIDES
jgi:hypothetical protein